MERTSVPAPGSPSASDEDRLHRGNAPSAQLRVENRLGRDHLSTSAPGSRMITRDRPGTSASMDHRWTKSRQGSASAGTRRGRSLTVSGRSSATSSSTGEVAKGGGQVRMWRMGYVTR